MENKKIQYFIDYWRDLTHPSNSIETQLVHEVLYNPKELFKEFAEEIERKNLTNSDNKNFFMDKVNEFSSLDLQALEFIKPTLNLIKKQFSQKNDYSYLHHLLHMAIAEFENFRLGKEAIRELAEILNDTSNIDKRRIKHLVNLVIYELIHKKYSQKTINDIIDYIFSTYHMHDNILDTKFPHQIECTNYDSASDEYKEYQDAVKQHIDNLTEKERILSLSNYFDKQPENLKYVFQIKGLRAKNIHLQIGNVQIYNPKTRRLFKKPRKFFDELFGVNPQDEIIYCNGAVSIDVIDHDYAKQEALQMLDNILDIIASQYIDYKIPMTINKSKYYIIDHQGNEMGDTGKFDWRGAKDFHNNFKINCHGPDICFCMETLS